MPKLLTPPRLRSRSSGGPAEPTQPAEPSADAAARTRRRFQRRQRARRWVVLRRVLAVLAVVGLVAAGVWLVFFSSVFAVQQVEVRGTEVLSAAEVEDAAEVPLDVPLATSDLAAVQARVEELAPVESAEVSRAWPDGVRIEVTERHAVAVVEWEGAWRGLDPAGVLFRTYPERPTALPRLTIRAQTTSDALAEAAKVVVALPPEIAKRVDHLDVGSIDAISVYLSGGAVVNWGSADESGHKAEVLRLLMKQPARVYDVTAPGRPTLSR